jgi:hypothetical protein
MSSKNGGSRLQEFCYGFEKQGAIRFVFGRDASVDSLQMVNCWDSSDGFDMVDYTGLDLCPNSV